MISPAKLCLRVVTTGLPQHQRHILIDNTWHLVKEGCPQVGSRQLQVQQQVPECRAQLLRLLHAQHNVRTLSGGCWGLAAPSSITSA
jgi:hypothetical protein